MRSFRHTYRHFLLCAIGCLILHVSASPQENTPASTRQPLNDAWWTGPILAASGATLPRGHYLIEPYFYDVIGSKSNGLATSSYVLFGLSDGFSIGSIPAAGYNKLRMGQNSSGIRPADVTFLAQRRISQFHEGKWIPTSAVVVEETLSTGRYDQLGDKPANGLGTGAYTTTVGFYPQTYFWLPNGRILRMRFNLTQAFPTNVKVNGVSVYGTGTGFSGTAKPGRSFLADPSWEYSLTRKWVLALDTAYSHNWNTHVTGHKAGTSGTGTNLETISTNTGSSEVFALAPAVEYNWKSNLGIIVGTRVIPSSHNTNASITPVVAINFFR